MKAKHWVYIVLVVSIFYLLGGAKSLNCSYFKERKLIGTWTASTGCGSISITFNKDGTGRFSNFMGEVEQFHWSLKGNRIIFEKSDGRRESVRYEISDKSLILHYQNATVVFYR